MRAIITPNIMISNKCGFDTDYIIFKVYLLFHVVYYFHNPVNRETLCA